MLVFTLLSSTQWKIGTPEPVPDDAVWLDFNSDSGETVMRLYVLQGCDETSIAAFFATVKNVFGDVFDFRAIP